MIQDGGANGLMTLCYESASLSDCTSCTPCALTHLHAMRMTKATAERANSGLHSPQHACVLLHTCPLALRKVDEARPGGGPGRLTLPTLQRLGNGLRRGLPAAGCSQHLCQSQRVSCHCHWLNKQPARRCP